MTETVHVCEGLFLYQAPRTLLFYTDGEGIWGGWSPAALLLVMAAPAWSEELAPHLLSCGWCSPKAGETSRRCCSCLVQLGFVEDDGLVYTGS